MEDEDLIPVFMEAAAIDDFASFLLIYDAGEKLRLARKFKELDLQKELPVLE